VKVDHKMSQQSPGRIANKQKGAPSRAAEAFW